MDRKLLEKAINCYINYLNYLTYGINNQNYNILYNAWILLKMGIDEKKLNDYFKSHLLCPTVLKLNITSEMNRLITWTLNSSETLLNDFIWNDITITTLKTYSLNTESTIGYNYLYLSIPQDLNALIYDEMNNLLYDTSSPNLNFDLVGTTTTSKEQTNLVYRKHNMFNTFNPITFNIKLY